MKRISLITIGVLAVIVVGIGIALSSGYREMERSRRIEDEVARLREESDRIRGENRVLTDQIAFFSTESFEEREAKEKLGMRRSDEETVSVEVEPVTTFAATGADFRDTGVGSSEDGPIYRKWLALFGITRPEDGLR